MSPLLDTPERPVSAPVAQRALCVRLSTGLGSGATELAAFDAALADAGVANYNLLYLSSVIPPNAEIRRERHRAAPDDHGRRLYVVMSQMRESRPGHTAHAGIGWLQQGTRGPGLFVELHDEQRDRLQHDLAATLEDMRTRRPQHDYGAVQMEIASAPCTDRPVCALVVAVFACEPW